MEEEQEGWGVRGEGEDCCCLFNIVYSNYAFITICLFCLTVSPPALLAASLQCVL